MLLYVNTIFGKRIKTVESSHLSYKNSVSKLALELEHSCDKEN